jgi:hypothetical protein
MEESAESEARSATLPLQFPPAPVPGALGLEPNPHETSGRS